MPAEQDVPREQAVPVWRVCDAAAAVRWYARLGFVQQEEKRFEPGPSVFTEITRGHARLCLSEHEGDARPDTPVYPRVAGLEAGWHPAGWCGRSRRRNAQGGGGGSAGPGVQPVSAGRLVDRRLLGDRQRPRTGTRHA
ncbi:glyoxalase superfamily protein [Streptomyces incanus]|uniref:Glyoxalase superfamily protein n=1 Tax=Streptomyces incanus TaxID=887453 RepID=A0ABW0XKI6_9ACTN